MNSEKITQRKHIAEQFGHEFQEKTKRSLSSFFDVLFGFNVRKWDIWLEVPEGKSTSQVTTHRFGQAFMENIRSLL